MPIGAGKYDPECTAARESAQAEAVLLIVLNGNRGAGFSLQSVGGPATPAVLCDLLEHVVRQIRASLPPDAKPTPAAQ
jgi:hypothetical protein